MLFLIFGVSAMATVFCACEFENKKNITFTRAVDGSMSYVLSDEIMHEARETIRLATKNNKPISLRLYSLGGLVCHTVQAYNFAHLKNQFVGEVKITAFSQEIELSSLEDICALVKSGCAIFVSHK